jgi:hypothetical protein
MEWQKVGSPNAWALRGAAAKTEPSWKHTVHGSRECATATRSAGKHLGRLYTTMGGLQSCATRTAGGITSGKTRLPSHPNVWRIIG